MALEFLEQQADNVENIHMPWHHNVYSIYIMQTPGNLF